MKTILSYLIEAKLDDEYEKNFKTIDREIFDTIVNMDPKSQGGIGEGAKGLLLPRYMSGETDFIEEPEKISDSLNTYYKNRATYDNQYKNLRNFKSVHDFIEFINNPDKEIDIQIQVEEDPITKIYNKYYKDSISREIFDKIIAVDSKTTKSAIGEVSKNLLLPRYIKGDKNFLSNLNEVEDAINRYYKKFDEYEPDKKVLTSYKNVDDFINYTPPSLIISNTKNLKDGVDYKLVGESSDYEIYKLLTFEGSKQIAHTQNADNCWCTAGGSSGDSYLDSDGISKYWTEYTKNHNCTLYEIINKKKIRDRTENYNLALNSDGTLREFRDGANSTQNNSYEDLFTLVLLKSPDLIKSIMQKNDPLLTKCKEVNFALSIVNLWTKPFIIDSIEKIPEFYKLINNSLMNKVGMNLSISKIIIKNLNKIPNGLCCNLKLLKSVEFDDKLEEIGSEAFKNCSSLSDLVFPESLKIIGKEAFANCSSIKGSIRIPNNTTEIRTRAFANTGKCKLKISKTRKEKLKFDISDKEWVNSHAVAIDVENS